MSENFAILVIICCCFSKRFNVLLQKLCKQNYRSFWYDFLASSNEVVFVYVNRIKKFISKFCFSSNINS